MTKMKTEVQIQKDIAFTAGILQGDITIKTLLESLAEGVLIINEEGRIILINSRLAELTGYSKREVMGTHMNIFVPQFSHDKHNEYIKQFFNNPHIRPMGIGLELVAMRKDKSTFPVEISLSFLETETGRLGIGFLTDITSRKQVENDLLKRNLELDNYAHTVAHDLTSSLSGMVGYSELLIDPEDDTPKMEKDQYLKHIAESGKKMSNIIKELLAFACLKREDIDVAKIDMKSAIASTINRLKYQIEESSSTIKVHENIANCVGYSAWVEEVLYNYLTNAIKYGGNPPQIDIYSETSKDGFTTYCIKDNGQGIDEKHLQVIFDEQSNVKNNLTKGYGLGLSIAKRIVEKLDGFVDVESEVGKGSIFKFSLKKELKEK